MRHVMTEPTDGESLELAVGDDLVVRLEQQSGGGYLWSVAEVPACLSETSSEVEPTPRALPGQVRTAALGLRAERPGSGDVVVTLRRPWEAAATEQRRIHVEVVSRV